MPTPLRALALLSLVWTSAPASAQHGAPLVREGPFTFCVLHDDPVRTAYGPPVTHVHGAAQSLSAQAFAAPAAGQAAATFQVTYTGFTPEAQAAFQSAVDIWAQHVASAVPIRVNATFSPLGENVLGSAGATRIYANFDTFPERDTWYPNAVADALEGRDLTPGVPDIEAQFSSGFTGFYFGLDANPPIGQIDFRSVVLHELGHGLGFFGTADVTSGMGRLRLGPQNFPVPYDRLARDGNGASLLTAYPNESVELAAALQSGALFLDSPGLRDANALAPPRVFAPSVWNGGSSYSHWDEVSFPAGTPNALMTPFIGRTRSGSPVDAYTTPGPLTCALFREIGWTLGPACLNAVSVEAAEADARGVTLSLLGPNPVVQGTRIGVTLSAPGPVRAGLYDALGRRVRELWEGAAPAGLTTLRVDAAGLAPGVYVVRVEAAEGAAALRLVVAR